MISFNIKEHHMLWLWFWRIIYFWR